MSFESKLEKLFNDETSLAKIYRRYYISYGDLKNEVHEIGRIKLSKDFRKRERKLNKSAESEKSEKPQASNLLKSEQAFQDSLQNELDKVNMFAAVKRDDIFRSLQHLAEQCNLKNRTLIPSVIANNIRTQAKEIVHLEEYVRINYHGFSLIVQKFDAAAGSTVYFSLL
jgi:SPX domain protein involved in polyphosphate accumulation